MPTQAQLDANRRNAQHSTGPRTPPPPPRNPNPPPAPQPPAGKARAARNAVIHGYWAHFLLPSESEPAFRALRKSMILSLNPHTPLELELVHRAATLAWRLRR